MLKMYVIPAVDIKNGKCVQLVQGKPGTEQIIIENPEVVAQEWESKGAEILHVINLDGAFGNTSNNLEIIKKIIYVHTTLVIMMNTMKRNIT